jgi:subtilisin-like proprotein convertase family protein/V8-like Glu-specific endopeptidase
MRRFILINLIGLFLIGVVSCGSNNDSDDNSDANQKEEGTGYEPGIHDIHDKVIYGDDDRKDPYQVDQVRIRNWADSTVALIKNNSLNLQGNGNYGVSPTTYGQSMGLCPQEPFFHQTSAAFCSGSLVGEDLVLTAGHCIQNTTDCASTSLVFGYDAKDGKDPALEVKGTNVYRCSRVVKQILEGAGTDFTVIQLDRKVVGHAPLPLRRQGVVSVGDSLTVIGHPSGLPTKIAGGGMVRSVNDKYFVSNLDTYGGNSGSAVFNTVTGEIEGVLVRGDSDFSSQSGCYVSRRCPADGCRGEDVTRASQIVSYVPAIGGNPSPNPNPTPVPQPTKVSYKAKPNLKIPDANTKGVSSSVLAAEAVGGRKVSVTVNITHTYIGDLVLKLVDPSGQVVVLQTKKGGRTRDLRGTFGKELVAEGNLQSLQNSVAGTWKIQVSDIVRIDTGTLLEWSLNFE